MKTLMTRLVLAAALFSPVSSFAAYCTVSGTLQVFAQSAAESGAHMIVPSNTITTCSCPNNRLYINLDDTAQFAKALSASANNQSVTIFFRDDASPKDIAGHQSGVTCKAISIW